MNMKAVFAAGLVSVVLSGCVTHNPYTNEKETSSATSGAVVGAASGAVLGGIIGGNSKGMLVGAVAGGLIGTGIGYSIDQQEEELRHQLRSTGISVTRNGDLIELNMPNSLTFDVSESTLKTKSKHALHNVAIVLKNYEKTKVHVAGHTDNTGSKALNYQLSEVRASKVANYLMIKGVDGRRIESQGYGESKPIASNRTEYGRSQNRRVIITLTP